MSPQTLTEQLSDSAQEQLGVLREALENRLATLEEVLADPSRDESLAGLILDLSRIATEEAQAAASQACLAIKAEADKEITDLRTSAKAAVEAAQTAVRSAHASFEQERAIGVDLRRAADQAHLEIQKQAELLAAREQLEASLKSARERLEADVARQKTIAADLQRATEDAQQQLETERTAARKAHDDVAAELELEREALSGRERALAELQSDLDAERASGADARGAFERAETRASTLEREQAAARASHELVLADRDRERETAAARAREHADLLVQLEAERAAAAGRERAHAALQSELEAAHEAATDRERAYAELHAQLEAERASAAEMRRAAERATERATELGATLGRETSEGRAAQEELSSALARQREAEAVAQKALADGQQALAAALADLQSERTSNAGLREAVEHADQLLAIARSSETQTLADREQLLAELDRMRADAASAAAAAGVTGDIERQLATARAETDALRAETGERQTESQGLLAELDAARTRLDEIATERDTVAGELQAARQWIDDLREAEAEFASASPAAHLPPAPPPSPATPTSDTAPAAEDDGWQAVRLANRYVFGEDVAVQINGDPGVLFDLSISGCQLLSSTALKPNNTVKVTLPDDTKPVTCTGTVVWTRLEPPAPGRALRYRTGVHFTKADELAIETFAAIRGTATLDSPDGSA